MRIKQTFIMAFMVLSVLNCVSHGRFIEKSKFDQIMEKKTTKSEVDSLFSDSKTSYSSSGDYSSTGYSGCNTSIINYIPILNLFSSIKCSSASITYDKAGIVTQKTYAESGSY